MIQQFHSGIYSKKIKSLTQTDNWNSVFITALFIISKMWKQPMCLWTNDGLKKVIHTHIQTHTLKY